MDLIEQARARLAGDRATALERNQPQPPAYTYQDRDGRSVRLAGSDGSEAEVRMLSSGSLRVGDPVIRVGSLGIGRNGSRMPERRRYLPLVIPTGGWVYSSHEGALSVPQNEDGTLRYIYTTTPNTSLWEGLINFYNTDFEGNLYIEFAGYYQIREVDATVARYLDVSTPTRITITSIIDHLEPRYIGPTGFQARRPEFRFSAFRMLDDQPPPALNSPNDLINDAIAKTNAGLAYVTPIITADSLPGGGPNDYPSFDLDNPWNRFSTFQQIDNPIAGIAYRIGGTSILTNIETTVTRTFDIYDPGKYLLLGSWGADSLALLRGFDGVSEEIRIDQPNRIIHSQTLDTTITIAPIPPEPEPEP
ncbi:hypothetical protein [Leptolyngbya sp. FACHB-16]|uniref:hypothetical protein n=1 Tax=unclassified Leptolyngbya TaxID=2650499 RepID=UPI00168898DC|nr:hypothetical protein [Leptolyngbya sp. FACHB-16]MBD2156247.1 hypothetical protein [Leptolyngbya sp. FACHB-16]